ncbi:hypothetical protein [Oceanicoccus sp. KOV_DT_Chl]|uniref:hypothetical protein n=1 Tax=Oceanicoccus sp. KOV_DT_Chl TaxID=1904639 RepID=UPI000C7C1692|nr:hypothetical protein [Oceanicoccus sp. KOV_DT_Chl]
MKSVLLPLLLLLSTVAQAIELAATARVSIYDALAVAEITALDFGSLSNLNGTCTMDTAGKLSASAGQNCTGNSTPGIFRISGVAGQEVIVSVNSTQAVDGIAFTPVIAGSHTKTLTSGTADIKITGSLSLTEATVGDKNIPYTLTTHYQ